MLAFLFQFGGALAHALFQFLGQFQRLLEQAHTLDGDAELRAHCREDALISRRERERIAVVAHGQHADHLVGGEEGHAQEAPRFGHHRVDLQSVAQVEQVSPGQQQGRALLDDD